MSNTTGAGDSGGKGDGYFTPRVPNFSLGRRSDGKNGDGNGGNKQYSPWLVIRYETGDVGDRPLPSGTVFWESPDVWVVSTLGVNQPVPGEPNTVYARVTNLGMQDATGVFVQFWWANPSLAITETTANLIGTTTTTVLAGSSVVATCPTPWVPVVENGGHECLLAEAYSPVFDPLTAPLDPADDRHVGQKNEQLVLAQPGQKMSIRLHAANISGFAQPLTFVVQSPPLALLPDLLLQRQMKRSHVLTPATRPLPLSLQVADGPSLFGGPSLLFARRLFTMTAAEIAGTARYCSAPAQITRVAHFEPWEIRTVEIAGQVPADAAPGQVFTFRILQQAGNMVTGGYTVNVVVI
jgi:hypothetical protein